MRRGRVSPLVAGVLFGDGFGVPPGFGVFPGVVELFLLSFDELLFESLEPLLLFEEFVSEFELSLITSRLVEAITYSGRGVTVVEEKELWDMPIILLGLLALMGGEWMYRRARGLA